MCRFFISHSSIKVLYCHISFVETHSCLRCPPSKGSSFGRRCAIINHSPSNKQWPQSITYIIGDLAPLHCNWYILRMDTKDFYDISHRRSWPCTNSSINNNMFWSQFGIKISLLNFFQRSIHSLNNFLCAMASLVGSTYSSVLMSLSRSLGVCHCGCCLGFNIF